VSHASSLLHLCIWYSIPYHNISRMHHRYFTVAGAVLVLTGVFSRMHHRYFTQILWESSFTK